MDSLPGFSLEHYVAWLYDLVPQSIPSANLSLASAEAVGINTRRSEIRAAAFAELAVSPRFDTLRCNTHNIFPFYWNYV
jgi:hypothetical protein